LILAAGKRYPRCVYSHTIPNDDRSSETVMEFSADCCTATPGLDEVFGQCLPTCREIENGFSRSGQRFGVQIAYSFEGASKDGELIGAPLARLGIKKFRTFQKLF